MSHVVRATLALGFALATVGCAHRSPRNIQEIRGGGPPSSGGPVAVVPANTLRAESTFARTLGPCTYAATLSGHVHQTRYGSAGPPFGAMTYSPSITIATEVSCGPERPVVRATRTLVSDDLSVERMAQALGATGAVRVPVGTRTCTFRPEVAVSGDTVFIANVDEACSR